MGEVLGDEVVLDGGDALERGDAAEVDVTEEGAGCGH